jgi:hypothetical protein
MNRLRKSNMVAMAHSDCSILDPTCAGAPAVCRPATGLTSFRRRKVTHEAGRAIEMLGHAIEYLADEFALECRSREDQVAAGKHPRIMAIELMMTRNREIYFSCSMAPTLGERLRSLLHLQRA